MDQSSTVQGKKLLLLKTDLPALLAFILFAVLIFFILIPGFEDAMMERKRILIKEMTSSAYSLLEHYHSLEISGILDSEEAKTQARDAIGSIRYGEQLKDYFWITDREPFMVIHPYRPDLNGKDLSGFRDSKGKLIFIEFASAVIPSGESYVEYMWQWNDDSTKIVPKLSYVRLFEPWSWIVGTGIYIEDVRTEIRRMELRAITVSGIIGIIIMILLSLITRQSHRIEQNRRKTEEDLFRSRELYRTLAEAATEGVIIWTNNDIRANKTLLALLGYSEDEFKMKTVDEIFSSPDIDYKAGADHAYDKLGSRQFGECELKSADGTLLKAHSGYSRLLLGDQKAVVIVVRPLKQQAAVKAFNLPPGILKTIETGFFRISFGRKTRFLDATEPTLRILGFDKINDLLQFKVDALFVNPLQLRLLKKRLASKVPVTDMVLSLANKSGVRFEALVNIMVIDQNYPEIWCEGTIEYLTAAGPEEERSAPVPPRHYLSLVQYATVKTIMRKPLECSYDTPALKALEIMTANDSQTIVVINEKGVPSGSVDSSAIITKLANGEPAGTEVEKLISSPPEFMGIDKPVANAIDIMYSHGRRPLLITSAEGKLEGVITEREILKTASLTDDLIRNLTEKASNVNDLREVYGLMKQMAVSMIMGNTDPLTVSSFISGTADLICIKAIEICIDIMGPPPCKFAFIQTGSAGRMEQTLVTDQDNGIIFEDCEGRELSRALTYFPELGKKINEMLAAAGYNLCKGNNMAGNPEWSQPLKVWKEYFSEWIRVPEPSSLLDMSIFFDFRHCYGDDSLTEELRQYVNNSIVTNDIYFHHLASAMKSFKLSAIKEGSGITDIKRILMPLTGLIRLYTLKYSISAYSTTSRILALHAGGYFNSGMLRETLKSLKFLSAIRFNHQAECINGDREPDNRIDFSLAGENSLYSANMAIESINNLLLKAENEFYATEL
jgi:signal-transduction protein with cAMP-binding, CBS, and nucleotidyltransferase domain/PAS domain-containing protein